MTHDQLSPKFPSSLVTLTSKAVSTLNLPLILPIFSPYFSLPTTKNVLELASGQGTQIIGYFHAFSELNFWPTECDEYGKREVNENVHLSLQGKAKEEGKKVVEEQEENKRIKGCGVLDVLIEEDWRNLKEKLGEEERFQVVCGTNFLHMIPFPQGPQSIFHHLNTITSLDAHFLVYGPFKSSSTGFFSEADAQFDSMIKARPGGDYFGLRTLEGLEEIANQEKWKLVKQVAMPKGNWILVFKRQER